MTTLGPRRDDHLTEVIDVMDVSTINRLLQEVVQSQRTLHRELFDTVVRKEQIGERLASHQRSVPVLGSVQAASSHLHSDILEMSALANVVSDQVRQLDTERNSVQATIAKVVLNVDIAACTNGIKNSLEVEEYEAAAGFVEALLHLPGNDTDGSIANEKQHAHFNHTREAVASVIRDKISSAAATDNAEQVLTYGKLFPKLGLSNEGLNMICQYLCKRFADQSYQDRLSTSPDSSGGGGNFTILLSGLFRSVVSCIEEHGGDLVNTFGSNSLETLIRSLNKECDICGSQLLKRYMDYRNIFQTAKDVSAHIRNSTSSDESAVDPRVIEEYLEEIVSMCQISREYERFLMEKLTSGQHNDPHVLSDNSNVFNGDHYNRSLHEVVGFYIRLEEFFMYENVALAISINEQGDSLTGSMVDDIFFILQKCARRASETGSIQAVCASLNHVNNILSSEVHNAIGDDLQRAGSNFLDDIMCDSSAESDTRQPKSATAINNADAIADNIMVLKQDIEVNLDDLFFGATERERIKSCLLEIRDISGMFRKLSHDAIKDMVQGVLAHIRPIFDTIGGLSYELDEDQYSEHEACDPWVQHLLVELEEKVFQNLRPHFVSSSFNVFVGLFAEALAARIEGIILSELRFSQLGGLQLEREIRRLTLQLSSAFPHASVRESFARLTQMATILNMENPAEVIDFWGDLSGSKLAEIEIKKILKLRSDFKVEVINSLPAFHSR